MSHTQEVLLEIGRHFLPLNLSFKRSACGYLSSHSKFSVFTCRLCSVVNPLNWTRLITNVAQITWNVSKENPEDIEWTDDEEGWEEWGEWEELEARGARLGQTCLLPGGRHDLPYSSPAGRVSQVPQPACFFPKVRRGPCLGTPFFNRISLQSA